MGASARTRRVLVVDDQAIVRDTVRLALEAEGYEVAEAPDGKVGLEMLGRAEPVGLVLLDLEMPVMDGAEFVQRLRENPGTSSLPVVLCTASERTSLPGVQGALPKPFSLAELLAAVGENYR
jgi:CheY-like chemotaxis protein